MRYLAILKDSLVEALDRKSLYAMFVISAIFILLLASISYTEMDAAGAIQDMTQSFASVPIPHRTASAGFDAVFKVDGVRELGADAGTFDGGYAFQVTVSPLKAFHKTVRAWDAVHRGLVRKSDDKVPDLDVEAPEDLEVKFFKERYFERAMVRREVKRTAAEADRRVFDVKIKPQARTALEGAYRIHILFGAFSFAPPVSISTWVYLVEKFLSEWLAGLAGVLIALFLTAGSVPTLLQKGYVDVLVSKPIRRSTLLAYKYVGGLTYATLSSLAFIGGSWLVISARSGVWNWGYLATLGTLVLFFAVLYSLGLLVAVLTRSTVAAIAVPLFAWAAGSIINKIREVSVTMTWDLPLWLTRGLETASWCLPRPGDINQMNAWFIWRGSGGGSAFELIGEKTVDWIPIVGSSFLFIGVMLSLSCWMFSRRDY